MKKIFVNTHSSWILFLFLILYTFIRPVLKYFEYAHDSFRINFSVIFAFIAIVFIFLNYVYSNYKNKLLVYDSRTYILGVSLLYVIVIQIVQFPFILSECYNCLLPYFKTISSTIFSYILFFFLGFHILGFINNPKKNKLLFYSWLIYSLIIMINTGIGGGNNYRINLEGEQIYLMLADAYAFLSIIALFYSRKFTFRLMVFMLSSIALFVLLSRTSLYLFLLTGLVLLCRTHPFKMLASTLILFVACFIVLDFDVLQFKNDRMLRFLFTGKDSSWSHRARLLTEGYNHLYNHWILGEFMWEVKKNGGQTGGYIHNFLSIMNQFGVIPFLIIIVSILVAYLKIGFSFIFRGKESTYFLFTIASFSFLAIIFSRSYQVPYFWLSLTAIFSYFKQNYDKRTSVHFNASKK